MKKSILLLVAYFIPLAVIMYQCFVNGFSADQLLHYRDQLRILADMHLFFSIIDYCFHVYWMVDKKYIFN